MISLSHTTPQERHAAGPRTMYKVPILPMKSTTRGNNLVSWILTNSLNPAFLTGIACGLTLAWTVFRRNGARKNDNHLSVADSTNAVDMISGSAEGECKLIIVVRADLKMGKGKVAAQCSHAAVSAYKKAKNRYPQLLEHWEESGQAKIVVKVENETGLLELATSAKHRGLITTIIQDAGRTQIEPGSKTVLGVGPGPSKLVDEVTSHLKLY